MANDSDKRKIVETALSMFNSRGCKVVTMDNIAQELHISKRTLYETFENKEELLSECLKTVHDEIERRRNMAAERVQEPLLLTLYMVRVNASIDHRYDNLVSDTERYYPDIYNRYFITHTHQFREVVMQGLNYAECKGYLRKGVDKEAVADTVVCFVQEHRMANSDNKEDFLRSMGEAGFTFLRGLMSVDTIKRYEQNEPQMGRMLSELEQCWERQTTANRNPQQQTTDNKKKKQY